MDAFHYRLKAAQRDLIERCGGINRVEKVAGFSRSQVGRWNNPNDTDHMSLVVVRTLEADAGQPVVTAVMAEINGWHIADTDDEPVAKLGLMAAHSNSLFFQADIARDIAAAIADGRVSPAEAAVIDRAVAKAVQGYEELRASLAEIKARGGEAVSLQFTGEGQ